MTIVDHPQFKEILIKIKEANVKRYNLGLVSLPGSGATYYLKRIVEDGFVKNAKYISEAGQELSDFNFLDLDFNKNKKALEMADVYIKSAGTTQKSVVVINTPEILKTPRYLESITSNRVFEYTYMIPMTEIELDDLASRSQVEITEAEVKKVLVKTGGVSRLVKYFLLHKDQLDWSLDELMEKRDFSLIFEPTVLAMYMCDLETLRKMKLYEGGRFAGELFNEYFETHPKVDMVLSVDGKVVEGGIELEEQLLKHEVELLRLAVVRGGVLTKEEISEIRWGEGSYEKFSDQAIKKMILRLNEKLKKYVFEAIPTIGYKLIER